MHPSHVQDRILSSFNPQPRCPPPTQLRVTSFPFFQPHQPSGWAERRITTARFPGRQRKSLEKRRWEARGEGREREWEREREKKRWRWSEGKEKHPWLVFSGPGHDKEEKLKKERKKNRNEEGEVLSFAQGTRSMFRKNENERIKRERGGIQNCGYIPFVASPALSASSLELFSKRFI